MRTLAHTWLAMPLVWMAALLSPSPVFGDTIPVSNTNDSGAGSLRAAIETAAPGDTIVFSLNYPAIINLTSGSLLINTDLSIDGPGASNLTIDASGNPAMERAITVGPGVTVSISGVTVTGGRGGGTNLGSSANSGGGIFNSGRLTLSSAVLSDNSTTSQGIGGGGVFNAGGATLTLTNCLVWGNTAGGGTIQQGGLITGGGIRNANSGLLTLIDTTVSNNAAHVGGGIWNNGTLTVTGSTFSGNSAGVDTSTNVVMDGGAIYVSSAQGTGSITNSTFFNNGAKSHGAAIANAGTLNVTNSTFSENWTQAGPGGAVSTLGNVLTIKGSILSNAAGNCLVSGGSLVSDGYNLSTDASCQLSGAGDVISTPAGLDPAGLQDHGGPTQTIALLSTSAAVDRIPTPCTDADENPLSTDQRGVMRPQGNGCDSGAFELIGRRADNYQFHAHQRSCRNPSHDNRHRIQRGNGGRIRWHQRDVLHSGLRYSDHDHSSPGRDEWTNCRHHSEWDDDQRCNLYGPCGCAAGDYKLLTIERRTRVVGHDQWPQPERGDERHVRRCER